MNEEEKDDIVKKLGLMGVRHVALSLSRRRWENGDKQSFHAVWLNSLILSSQGHRRERDVEFQKWKRVRLSCESFWKNLPTSFVVDDRVINTQTKLSSFFFIYSFCWKKENYSALGTDYSRPLDYWEQPIKIVATHITFRPFPVTTGKTRWQFGVKNELELTSLSWFGTF